MFDYIKQELKDRNAVLIEHKRPLVSIAMHPSEDSAGTSKIRLTMSKYADCKVGEYYGLSLLEFLELPVEYAEFILSDCEKRLTKHLDVQENALNALKAGNETKK